MTNTAETATTADPRAPFLGRPDSELGDELARLNSQRRSLGRILESAVTRDSVAEDVKAAQARGVDRLASLAAPGLAAAQTAVVGTQGWRQVEELVVAFVLASPDFSKGMVRALGEHLPTEADLAPRRAELARIEERMQAIQSEQAARHEEVQAAYLASAFKNRTH